MYIKQFAHKICVCKYIGVLYVIMIQGIHKTYPRILSGIINQLLQKPLLPAPNLKGCFQCISNEAASVVLLSILTNLLTFTALFQLQAINNRLSYNWSCTNENWYIKSCVRESSSAKAWQEHRGRYNQHLTVNPERRVNSGPQKKPPI